MQLFDHKIINNIIKKYGHYFFMYILMSLLLISLNMIRQLVMITLLLLFIGYYKLYFNSPSELLENIKSPLNNSKSLEATNKNINELNSDVVSYDHPLDQKKIIENNDKNMAKLLKFNLEKINSVNRLNNLNDKIMDYVCNYMPIESIPELYNCKKYDIEKQNNVEFFSNELENNLIKFQLVIFNLINAKQEEQNYLQQLDSIVSDICNLVHSVIFLNHESELEASKLIRLIKDTYHDKIYKDILVYINTYQNNSQLTYRNDKINKHDNMKASNYFKNTTQLF